MKRLVCVGEGHGEVSALPRLCHAIRSYLGADEWSVDPDCIRLKRADFVGPSLGARRTTRCNVTALTRAVELARRRPGASAVILVCDADDDCAAEWSASLSALRRFALPVGGVMAVREYEAWLLWNLEPRVLRENAVPDPESKRDAKGALRRVLGAYAPTTHQLELTRKIDVPRVRAASKSFDKLVRAVAAILGVEAPPRMDS